MARRSFNRVLGQTSLELKCLFLFGVFLLVVMAVSFFLYWRVAQHVVYEQNPNTGRLLVDQAMVNRHSQAFEKDELFLAYLEDLTEKLAEQEYRWRFIFRPDYVAESVDQQGRPQDEFEEQLLKRVMQTPPEDEAEAEAFDRDDRLVSNGDEYQYYQAIRAQRTCLGGCHPTPPDGRGAILDLSAAFPPGGAPEPLREGDLMAVVQVTIPNGPTQEVINWSWNMLLAVAIITAFLAMIAFYVVIRYVIIQPVRHLRDVSDAIRQGDIALRAKIHTGDEFELLAVAFNRMLRHLVNAQDQLRLVNTSLDGKVDELAQLNMQLYEMNRVKSDFMATMSHELRTPLNSILGFSDVLGSIAALDDKHKRYVENIQKSGRMLLDMINNILDLAKIESGKIEIRTTDFSIAQVIHTQCDMARPLTEKKNIDLATEIQPDLPPIRQDQVRVQQIINNLLSNAIKFTPEGGRIKVTAEQNDGSELILRVMDTGVGISEEDQQAIFEKFRQGQTALPGGDAITREYSGTGLGLSIVKELCKLLEGEVSVESELGTGSTFTVRLPWELEEQPRLDSPLVAGFEEFSRPRLEIKLADQAPVAEPLRSGGGSQTPDNN